MMRSCTMRLKTTKRQNLLLADLLEHLCVLYNSALDQRNKSWNLEKKSVSYYDQQAALASFRGESSEVAVFPAAVQRDPLRRVDLAFKGFFRRCKAGENPGYPRFKAKSQYDSFSVDAQNFRLFGDTINIVKLGGFRFKTHYKLKGIPKLLHVKRCGGKWIAGLVCDIGEAPAKVAVKNAIGIDLGLTSLVTLSDGSEIPVITYLTQVSAKLIMHLCKLLHVYPLRGEGDNKPWPNSVFLRSIWQSWERWNISTLVQFRRLAQQPHRLCRQQAVRP